MAVSWLWTAAITTNKWEENLRIWIVPAHTRRWITVLHMTTGG